ncbi:unnamed protein product, partial [Nesidiocoris tenuis]
MIFYSCSQLAKLSTTKFNIAMVVTRLGDGYHQIKNDSSNQLGTSNEKKDDGFPSLYHLFRDSRSRSTLDFEK